MFEFMYPQQEGAYFKATDSNESAGISGTSVNELNKDRHFEAVVGRNQNEI